MLSAAKSFRLPFRRASVVKGAVLSPENDGGGSSHESSSLAETRKRTESGNQSIDSNGDAERLYVAIHALLAQPVYARLSEATCVAALERIVHDIKRRSGTQLSTPVAEPSEQSDTEWEDWDHTVEPETRKEARRNGDSSIACEAMGARDHAPSWRNELVQTQTVTISSKPTEQRASTQDAGLHVISSSATSDHQCFKPQSEPIDSLADTRLRQRALGALTATSPFDLLSYEELRILIHAPHVVIHRGEDGKKVIGEGEAVRHVFVLVDGEITMLSDQLAAHSAPFVLFEPATLISSSDMSSSYTVRAVGSIQYVMLPCEALQPMLAEANELLNGLLLPASNTGISQSVKHHVHTVEPVYTGQSLSRNLTMSLLRATAPELDACEAICLMLNAVHGLCESEDAAIFIVNADADHAMRWSLSGSTCTVPLRGIARISAVSQQWITLRQPHQDERYDAATDLEAKIPLLTLASIPIVDENKQCVAVLQLTRTLDYSTDELLDIQTVMRLAIPRASFLRVQCQPQPSIPPPTLSISIGSLQVPLSASLSLAAVVPIAAHVSATIFFGQEQLFHTQRPVPSSTATRTIDDALLFAFHEPLSFPDASFVPRGSRIVVHVHIRVVPRVMQRRRSSIFGSGSGISARNLLDADTGSGSGSLDPITNGLVLSAWGGCYLHGAEDETDTRLRLWTDGEYDVLSTPACGLQDPSSSIHLHLHLPRLTSDTALDSSVQHPDPDDSSQSPEIQKLRRTLATDVFHQLTPEDRSLLWTNRRPLLRHDPLSLRWLLRCVTWTDRKQVTEYHSLLSRCPSTDPPELALHLLGPHVADPPTRAYAVHCLHSSPATVALYALQLVHALRHEPHHDSSLARLLVSTALRSPTVLGTQIYWLLRTEMDDAVVRHRYRTVLATLLHCLGTDHRRLLLRQAQLVYRLQLIHRSVSALPDHADRQTALHQCLHSLPLPANATLPLAPTRPLLSLLVDRCRVLSSKQRPLYLVFQLEQHDTLAVLFKSGDDLRQDQLVLQLFATMNTLWPRDLHLVTYGCVATSTTAGFIQVVRDAETVAAIFSLRFGHHKLHAALGVLTEQHAITDWLRGQRHQSYRDQVRRFASSCAASCVASYVLGLGDRHNDNIMLTRDGQLFHIDFGHILGHFKSKFGVQRERTMFVFTPAFAAVLTSEPEESQQQPQDRAFLRHLKHAKSCCQLPPSTASSGSDSDVDMAGPRERWQRSIHASLRFATDAEPPAYELFTRLCCDGYNAVRHHAALLYDLCLLMASGGALRQLRGEQDLAWLRNQLRLQDDDAQASRHFLRLLRHSVASRATLLNDAAHMLNKHG